MKLEEQRIRPTKERTTTSSMQYGIAQVLLWTAVAAIVVATIKFFPLAVLVAVLMAFVYVPIGPFVLIFATIAFGKEKDGALAIDHILVKILIAFWVISVIMVLAICLLIYFGLTY